jgi:hypothetical protein
MYILLYIHIRNLEQLHKRANGAVLRHQNLQRGIERARARERERWGGGNRQRERARAREGDHRRHSRTSISVSSEIIGTVQDCFSLYFSLSLYFSPSPSPCCAPLNRSCTRSPLAFHRDRQREEERESARARERASEREIPGSGSRGPWSEVP